MRQALVGGLVAAVSAVAVAPALAANQAVGVSDNAFTPGRVAVMPGESVTWTNPGSSNPHSVRFEDGGLTSPSPPSSAPWTATRTFTTDGAYRFYCEIHGSPGGGGMSGTVYVNPTASLPPLAGFTVSPNPAQIGQVVNFNGTGSSGTTASKYEWDLDGNGSFETDTGTTPTTSRSYSSRGALTVKLRVTDSSGASDETTRSLRINAAPTASFTTSPNPALTGQIVSFNGVASSDPDGFIARYEWDLDGNGSFETDSGGTPTTSGSYSSPGALAVRLRVTDGTGATGETTRSLQINPFPPPPISSVQPPVVPPQPEPKRGKCSKLKGKRRTACIRRRCGKLKGARRRACVKKVTRRR